jgi:hypothetical protein
MENNQNVVDNNQIIIFPQKLDENAPLLYYVHRLPINGFIFSAIPVNIKEASPDQTIYYLRCLTNHNEYLQFCSTVKTAKFLYLLDAIAIVNDDNVNVNGFQIRPINSLNMSMILNQLIYNNTHTLYFLQQLTDYCSDNANVRTDITDAIGIGNYSNVYHSNGIAIGHRAISKHKNAIVIGNDICSKNEDSILIGDVEVINGNLYLADNNLIFYGNNTDVDVICGCCNIPLTSGIQWTYDSKNGLKMKLCFQCIFDIVLKHKASESDGNAKFNEIKIQNLENQINILQDQVTCLSDIISKVTRRL